MGAQARKGSRKAATKTQARKSGGYRYPHDMYAKAVRERWPMSKVEAEKAKHFPSAKVPARTALAGVRAKLIDRGEKVPGLVEAIARAKDVKRGRKVETRGRAAA